MKETKGSIAVKLLAVAAFIGFIGGGGYIMYYTYVDGNWRLFTGGCCLLALGFFSIGVLGQLIMRYEKNGSLVGLSPLDCLKAGFMAMCFASALVFVALSIMAWVEHGLWQLGVSGIVMIVVMIIAAIEVSIRFQTDGATKKVKKNRAAVHYVGKVVAINPHMPIMVFFKTIYLFYEYVIEVDGTRSKAFLRRGSKLRNGLVEGSEVVVLFDPKQPKNCAITENNS
ncbi:MAG: hypothetical protein K2M48_06380 [Clostridiales bacterium]|nr:hypothetical protein [Clostridiales bacterium]